MRKYTTRNDFGLLFMEHMQKGIGAEIGVQNGYNSMSILRYWTGNLLCIDTWPTEQEFITAHRLLNQRNTIMIKGASADVAKLINRGTLDFVYIDAGHSYHEVKSDFEAWEPRVCKGGIVSWHDYGVNDCFGVKEFIYDYMKLHPEVKMNFTTEDFFEGREYQSWWFIKK